MNKFHETMIKNCSLYAMEGRKIEKIICCHAIIIIIIGSGTQQMENAFDQRSTIRSQECVCDAF